jgi:putative ABC transport system permease protein
MRFYEDATRAVSAVPGVRTIGWSTGLPYGSTSELGRSPFEIVGDPPIARENRPMTDFQAASSGYFSTLDLPIVAGRAFAERDTGESPLVCIVNEAFVRRHLGGRNPIGMRIAAGPADRDVRPAVREIVGVAKQIKERLDETEPSVLVYVPLSQFPWSDTYLVVTASSGPVQALVTPIRDAIVRVDRNVPVRRERTLTDLANLTTAAHRFRAVIVAAFAGLSLALAMVGIFGVLSYAVEQRTRELGVRIALGATSSSVLRLILGNAARIVSIGALIGLAAAAGLAQAISTFLFGVQPLDLVSFTASAAVLVLTAAIATAVPAWRATRVDPVVAFRNE